MLFTQSTGQCDCFTYSVIKFILRTALSDTDSSIDKNNGGNTCYTVSTYLIKRFKVMRVKILICPINNVKAGFDNNCAFNDLQAYLVIPFKVESSADNRRNINSTILTDSNSTLDSLPLFAPFFFTFSRNRMDRKCTKIP